MGYSDRAGSGNRIIRLVLFNGANDESGYSSSLNPQVTTVIQNSHADSASPSPNPFALPAVTNGSNTRCRISFGIPDSVPLFPRLCEADGARRSAGGSG
jgi:hypothetical protein